jgi:hypothetical protein
MPNISEIQMRDPFMVRDGEDWYLFGSTDKDIWRSAGVGFDLYRARGRAEGGDCPANFEGPFPAFRPPAGFWSEKNFWAPEVHPYRGAWYMFATFKPREGRRGTAILKSEKIGGPYLPWSRGPVTPPEWECLDGTFHTDAEGRPWMVFCHEWVQVGDGEICLMPLTEDLRAAAGKPELLFRASGAPWAHPLQGRDPGRYPVSGPYYVTDGPNLYRAKNGRLLMVWSSFGPSGEYCIGAASSESGTVKGPWKQSETALYGADGGHGMIFSTGGDGAEGRIFLTVHSPNKTPLERPVFVELRDREGVLAATGRVIRN